MTISEQVQNDYTVAWQVIGPMARQLSLGELVQPSGTWLNDDTIGVFACPDGIQPVINSHESICFLNPSQQ